MSGMGATTILTPSQIPSPETQEDQFKRRYIPEKRQRIKPAPTTRSYNVKTQSPMQSKKAEILTRIECHHQHKTGEYQKRLKKMYSRGTQKISSREETYQRRIKESKQHQVMMSQNQGPNLKKQELNKCLQ